MDCNKHQKPNQPGIEIKEVSLIDEVEEPSDPFDNFSNAKTLEEWLVSLCANERPKTKIKTYDFGFSETANEYFVYLIGLNTYNINENHTMTRIDFEPSHMYFRLPKSDYENFDQRQVHQAVKGQLSEFIKTERFRTSFFSQAESIKTSFDGNEIWSK